MYQSVLIAAAAVAVAKQDFGRFVSAPFIRAKLSWTLALIGGDRAGRAKLRRLVLGDKLAREQFDSMLIMMTKLKSAREFRLLIILILVVVC